MEIRTGRIWNKESVRSMCIQNCFCEKATNEVYLAILSLAEEEPTEENVLKMAIAICRFSSGCSPELEAFGTPNDADIYTIEDVCGAIYNEAIITTVTVKKGGQANENNTI